jgi:hypothetical protein
MLVLAPNPENDPFGVRASVRPSQHGSDVGRDFGGEKSIRFAMEWKICSAEER